MNNKRLIQIIAIFLLGSCIWAWGFLKTKNTLPHLPSVANIDNYNTAYGYSAGLYTEGWEKLPHNGIITIMSPTSVVISVSGDCNFDKNNVKAPMMIYHYVYNMKMIDCPDGQYSVAVSTQTTSDRVNFGLFIVGADYNYLWCVTEKSKTITLDKINSNTYLHNTLEFAYSDSTIELLMQKAPTTFQVGVKDSQGNLLWSVLIDDTISDVGIIVKGWKDFWGNCPALTVNFGQFKYVPNPVIPSYTAPSAPVLNTVTQTDASIQITWSAPTTNGGSPITKYSLYRSTDNANYESLTEADSSTCTFIDEGLIPAQCVYYYKLTASNAYGISPESNSLSCSYISVPSCPLNPQIFQLNNHQLQLSWTAPSSNGGTVLDAYQIHRSIGNPNDFINYATTQDQTYLDTTTTNGITYYYRILAHNSQGLSDASTIVSALARDNPAPAETTNLPESETSIRLGQYSSIIWRIQDGSVLSSAARYSFKYALNGGEYVTAYSATTWNGALTELALEISIYGSATRIQIETYVNDGQGQSNSRQWDLQIINEIPEIRTGTEVPQGELHGTEEQAFYIYDPSLNPAESRIQTLYRVEAGVWQIYQTITPCDSSANYKIPYSLFNTAIGQYELRVTVSDGYGKENVRQFNVIITNSAPILTGFNFWAFENDEQTNTPSKNAQFFTYACVRDKTPGDLPAVTFQFCQIDNDDNWISLSAEITLQTPEDGLYSCWLHELLPLFEVEHFMVLGVICSISDGVNPRSLSYSNTIFVQNSLPIIKAASYRLNEANQTHSWQASVNVVDLDDDPIELQFRWYKTSPGQSEQLLMNFKSQEIPNNVYTHGEVLRYEVRAGNLLDMKYYWSSWFSSDKLTITNSLPVISLVHLPPNATNARDVIPLITASDTQDNFTLEYRWKINGLIKSTTEYLAKTLFQHGDHVQLEVRAYDDYEPWNKTAWIKSNEIIIGNTIPVLKQVGINRGMVFFDDFINVTANGTDGDSDLVLFRYEFYVNNQLVQNGSSASLAPTMFRGGDTVFCVVYAFDSIDPTQASTPLQTSEVVVEQYSRYDGLTWDIFLRMNRTSWLIFGGSFGVVFFIGLKQNKKYLVEAK